MADGGATFYLVSTAIAATGAVVQTMDAVAANERREQILNDELRTKELQALDEEVNRLRDLRYANDDMLARAGGIDAYASPSLVAMRAFNFRMYDEDTKNIKQNLLTSKAGISAKISMLRANSKAQVTAGIFEVAGMAYGAMDGAGLLGKEELPATKATLGGRPLANDPRISGTL